MLLAVAVCALTGLGVASSVATANNGAVTTHFTKAYTDPSEDCTILNGYPAGTYVEQFGGWNSDSIPPSHSAGLHTFTVTIVVTDNGDGSSNADIVAYY